MNKQANRRSRGFTLIEIMVVVAIIAGVVGTILFVMTGEAKKAAGERAVAKMAEEMSLIARAVDDYYTDARIAAISANNVTQTVTINTLVTEALLPPNFANRQAAGGVALGVSPFGQPYAVRAVRLPGNILTFVVFDTGTVMPGPISRSGYNTNTDTLTALKAQIASEVSVKYEIPTGIIRQGETTARGGFNGFTLDVATYVGTAVTQPTAIVLKGFPQLEPDGAGGDDEGSGFSGNCRVVAADDGCRHLSATGPVTGCGASGAVYVGPTCPSGYTERDRWPACGDSVGFRTTPIGANLSYAKESSTLYGAGNCKSSCEEAYECGDTNTWKQTSIEVYVLNGIRVEDALCSQTQKNNWDIDYGSCGYRIRNYQTVTTLSGGTKESILCCIE